MATSYGAPGVYIEEFEIGAKPIEGVSTSVVGFVGITTKGTANKATEISSYGDFIEKFGNYHVDDAPYLSNAVYGFFSNGGQRCYVVKAESADDAAYIGVDGEPGKKTGLKIFKEIDEISIVCIPGVTSQGVQMEIVNHCAEMEDRFCILDCLEDADNAQVKDQINTVVNDKGIAALYYPWIQVNVEITNNEGKVEKLKKMFMPPSGYVAGIYARSDSERGVYKAPANEIVRGVFNLKLPLTKRDQDGLNPEGVNCIRAFKGGRGIRVWGARTTATKSNPLWKYINVRRLFLYLEESIEEGTQWVVFEPNDEKLWGRVRATITEFLTRQWRDGALMGTKVEDAFFVKCDRTTMTQDDILNGKLICVIGVAPVRPAEFVIFRIAQLTSESAADAA